MALITQIPAYAFQDCSALTRLSIPDGVTSIGSYAFSGCSRLTSADFPDGLTIIENNAFRACPLLTSAVLSANTKRLGDYAFYDCPAFRELTVPNPVCNIGTAIVSVDSITVYGCSKSTAFDYADLYGYTFQSAGKASLSYWTPSLSYRRVSYTGEALCTAVMLGNLKEHTDYTVSYEDNKNAGTARVIITGTGECTGSIETEFTILPISFGSITPVPEYTAAEYTGTPLEPSVEMGSFVYGKDYTLSYKNNNRTGTAAITVTGTGNYTGTKTASFTITPKDISGVQGELEYKTAVYTGSFLRPSVTIEGLVSGTDYTCIYADNLTPGTATVTVTGRGNCTGTLTFSFEITPQPLTGKKVTFSGAFDDTYSGTAKEPSPYLSGLKKGTDYTVSYENNINAGEAFAVLTGIGNYTGILKVPFTIKRAYLSGASFLIPDDRQAYDGTPKEPSIHADGLTEGADFMVSYSDNVQAGTATATITGIGNYDGTVAKTFRILPKSL